MKLAGGCHCGAVRFALEAEPPFKLLDCNCSICSRTGYLHLIVPHEHFEIERGRDDLSTYRFGTEQADHLFCRHCGIKSFYRPRSHPDAWSVNFRCLDNPPDRDVHKVDYDGRNWEEARKALSE